MPTNDWRPLVPVFPDELAADGIVLRTPAHDDVPILAAAFADPVLAGEAGLPLLDEEQLHALLDEQLPHWHSSGLLVPYTIVDSETGAILGGVTLRQLDATRHAIEIGYWLFAKARGRGVATQAVATLLDRLFANGLYRVEAIVRIGNTPSERVLERNWLRPRGSQATVSPLRQCPRRLDALLAPGRRRMKSRVWSARLLGLVRRPSCKTTPGFPFGLPRVSQ